MTLANDTFLLTIISGSFVVLMAVIGFLIQRLLNSFEISLEENTEATKTLTKTLHDIGAKVLIHEERMIRIDAELLLMRQKIHSNSNGIQELLLEMAKK